MRISDWSSDVCSSDLPGPAACTPPCVRRLAATQLESPTPPRPKVLRALPDVILMRSASGMPASLNWLTTCEREFGQTRTEERRVGKECVRTCRSRWYADHAKKQVCKTSNRNNRP